MASIAELEKAAQTGDPTAIIQFLFAYIKKVEAERIPGPMGPAGAPGCPGAPGASAGPHTIDFHGDQSIYVSKSDYNGKTEVRIGLSGIRSTIPMVEPLPKNPTVEQLLDKVQELLSANQQLMKALRDRQIIY